MKIILATITALLLFSCAFGQTTATNAEIDQLFKDAETDFASIQGEVQYRGGGIISYQTTKNYFQSFGFTNWFRYYEAEKTIGLQFSGSGESAKKVFDLVKEKFKSKAEIRSMGNSDGVFVNDRRIALLQETSDKYVMWFYSNRADWSDFNKTESANSIWSDKSSKSMDEVIDEFLAFGKNVAKSNESLLKQCKEDSNNKKYKQAIESCTKAIKADEKGYEAYLLRGVAYSNTEDGEKDEIAMLATLPGGNNNNDAKSDFLKCTQINPKIPECFAKLGAIHLKIDVGFDYEEAIKSLTEAIRLKPDYTEAYYYRGLAYVKSYSYSDTDTTLKNKKLNAIADFTKAITLHEAEGNNGEDDLSRQSLYLSRSDAYKIIGKKKEACQDLKTIGEKCK